MKSIIPHWAAVLCLGAAASVQASSKLVITPTMIINESGIGDTSRLVDEQAQAGDPRGGAGGPCWNAAWTGGWDTSFYPCHAIIDLGKTHQITDIYIFDRGQSPNNINKMEFSAGSPFHWTSLFIDDLPNMDQWNGHSVNVTTRYLRVSLHGWGQSWFPTEIVVYGTPVGSPEPTPTPTAQVQRPVKDLIGTNTFLEDPPGRVMMAGHVREYHPWSWSEYYQDQNAWGPSYAAGGGWNFDHYYDRMKKLGITVAPVVMQNAPYLYGGENHKPVVSGTSNTYSPSSYVAHGKHMWQFAARFGGVQHADNKLKLASGQPRVSGLNTLKYYENWNEQDQTWSGAGALFHPFEYAAMASADYDGHMGTLGNDVGVKNADPNAQLVMGGIANGNAGVDYLRMLKFWADEHRSGQVPIDVINVHIYSNSAGIQHSGTSTVGVSPELDDLKTKMAKIVDYRNRYMPGKEVWVSEFGYDCNQNSIQRAPAFGPFSAEEVQGQWLVRSYLALAAAGIDRAQQFMLRDDDANSSTTYSSSGLVSSKATGFMPKISWYYVYTLKNRLGRYTYAGEVNTGNANVKAYKFSEGGVVKGYAVWCPTSNNTTVSNYQLTLDGSPTTATLVQLVTNSVNGTETNLPIAAGKVTLNVSERPAFVLLDNSDADFEIDQKIAINPSMVTKESGMGDAGMIADEQADVGEPFYGSGATAAVVDTKWDTSYAPYPATCYVDLGSEKYITALCFMDMHGIGDLVISTGTPGNWTEVATQSTQGYESWTTVVLKKTTRYVRLTRTSSGASFNEIVLYGRSQAPPPDGDILVWNNIDIGSPGAPGGGTSGSMFTVSGAGAQIWQNNDQFHFFYRQMTGDFEIKVRALSHPYQNYNGKAGVMIREKLASDSTHAFVGTYPGGVNSHFMTHIEGQGWSGAAEEWNAVVPYWLKLTRQGNAILGAVSSNGVTWDSWPVQTVPMGQSVYVGFGVCSGTSAYTNTATFDNVTITPLP
jgi:regulation of enolase protein 1 (concanavalin A-like superfamily)